MVEAPQINPDLSNLAPFYLGTLGLLRPVEDLIMTDELSRIMFGVCLIASGLVINLQLP